MNPLNIRIYVVDYGLQTFRVLHISVSFQLFLFLLHTIFHVFFISIQLAWCLMKTFKLNLVPINFGKNCNLNRECKISKIKHVLITRFLT